MAKKDEILNLNVGGKKFTVRRSDLCADQRSRLADWFKLGASRPVPQDKSGNYYLDRDGKTFRYIIAYLRTRRERVTTPALALPMKPDVLANIVGEAEALGLEDLRNDCLDLLQAYQREELGHAVAYTNRIIHMYEEFQFDNRMPLAGPGRKKKVVDPYDEWDG